MPEMSSARTFVTALQTRRTNSTKALDALLANDPDGNEHPQESNPNFARLQVENALSTGPGGTLPAWARRELTGAGLNIAEVDHIGRWPAAQREQVREALVAAIQGNDSINFFWDLFNDDDEETVIDGGTITFLSPRSRVHALGPDNIVVGVGDADPITGG